MTPALKGLSEKVATNPSRKPRTKPSALRYDRGRDSEREVGMPMLETVLIELDRIYVPVKMRKELVAKRVELLAESYLDAEHQPPIQVRPDGERWILVKGINRLEALKSLGEAKVEAIVVRARRH
jgi:hypothetical protein